MVRVHVKRRALKLRSTVRVPNVLMLLPLAVVMGGSFFPEQLSRLKRSKTLTSAFSCVNQKTPLQMMIETVKQAVFVTGDNSHYRQPANAFLDYVQGGCHWRATEPHR